MVNAWLTVCQSLSALSSKGLFHIFGANVINKVVGFGTNIAIVWFLTKDEYGIFSYASNIFSIALLFTGFGLLTGMYQLCLEDRPDQEKSMIRRYTLTRGMLVDAAITLVVVSTGLFIPLPIEAAGAYLALFGPLLLLDYAFQYASVVLRMNLENKKFSALQSANTIAYFIGACFGAYLAGIVGTIAGRYIAYSVSLVAALYLLSSTRHKYRTRDKLQPYIKHDLWSYAIPTQTSSGINQLTYLLDVFLVGFFIQDVSLVATYKVATILPEGFSFIPGSIIMFALPYFVKRNHDRNWFSKKSTAFLGVGAVLYALIAILLVVLAPAIIELLWGPSYREAVGPFRILAISFVFNALRSSCTNLLCACRAVKSNLVVSLASLVVNVVLCLFLIPAFGIFGAAVAPMSVSIISAAISFLLLKRTVAQMQD